MNTHTIHLTPSPFNKIKSGQKSVESRLYDDKRRGFAVGDQLIFISREDGHEVRATIITLHLFPTFEDLFKNISSDKFANDSKEALLLEIAQFYSTDDERQWGVVGIEFKIT